MNVINKLFVGVVAVSLLLSGCSSAEPDNRFVSESGRFKVAFVTEPEEQVQNVPTPIGDIEMHMFPDIISDGAIFVVSYGDLPEGFAGEVDTNEFVVSAADGALQGFGISEVDVDEEFVMGGNSGLHRRGSAEEMYADYYNFLDGDRFYQMVFVKQVGFATEDELDAAMGTFELL